MEALVFAAGRGERMLPLTRACPKALLPVAGRPLIEHALLRLRESGFRDIVVNLSHLGEQIEARLGDGTHLGLRIRYSREPGEPLETGGGMRQALELIDGEVFVAINADVWTDYPLARLREQPVATAHLVLVANPPHHPAGDFSLRDAGGVTLIDLGSERFTFSGIGVYSRHLVEQEPPGRFRLAPLLRAAAVRGEVSGELYRGRWIDVGSPERLAEAESAAQAMSTG